MVTGSELVRGERTDLNGPFLARELLRLGLEPAQIVIVGDAAEELEAALRDGLDADLCVVSGGLGPTHDDRTVAAAATAAGVELTVDAPLEAQIADVSRGHAERLGRPVADFAAGIRKQATIPAGALSLGLAGTAPGLVLETGRAVLVLLPGPPAELRRLWERAHRSAPVRHVLARGQQPSRYSLRLYGVSESAVARALAQVGGEPDGVEATICAHDFEIHVELTAVPAAADAAGTLAQALATELQPYLFGRDERRVEELVLELCTARGLTLATAESCTGGLVAARLTSVPGSSAAFAGGVVSYSNAVKETELNVPAALIRERGAVSAEVAAAMARGVRDRLATDAAVAVTGVAGPGGGTPAKPVGLVYLHVLGPTGEQSAFASLPGDRSAIRARATAMALHLLRRVLTQDRPEDT